MSIALDKVVPDFIAPATNGENGEFSLAHQRGKKLVLYFYPKDDTPGCTNESIAFRDLYSTFCKANTEIVGISRDSLASHERFKAKLELPFALISDTDEKLCTLFAVIKNKKLYGKDVRGIERSTFLLDEHGVLRHEWRGVKVPDHAQEVLEAVQTVTNLELS